MKIILDNLGVIADDMRARLFGYVIAEQGCSNCGRSGPVKLKRGQRIQSSQCPRCLSTNTLSPTAPGFTGRSYFH